MNSPPFSNPRGVMAIWNGFLLAGLVLIVGVNWGLKSYVEHLRANDYRKMLAAASTFVEERNFAAALDEVERARSKAPNRPEPLEMLGHVQYRLENWPQAVAAFRAAINKGSQDLGIREIVVWALIEMGEYGEAVKFGKASIQAGLVPPALHRYIAEALFRNKQFEESITYFEHALMTAPRDLYMLDHLRQACEAIGETDKAQDVQRTIEEVHAAMNRAHRPEGYEPKQ